MAQARGTYVIDLDARSAQSSLDDFAATATRGMAKAGGAVNQVAASLGGVGGEAGKALTAVSGLMGAFTLGPIIGAAALLATGISHVVTLLREQEEAAKAAALETLKAFTAQTKGAAETEAALAKELRQKSLTSDAKRVEDARQRLRDVQFEIERALSKQAQLSAVGTVEAKRMAEAEKARARTLEVQRESLKRQLELTEKIVAASGPPSSKGKKPKTTREDDPDLSDADAAALVASELNVGRHRKRRDDAWADMQHWAKLEEEERDKAKRANDEWEKESAKAVAAYERAEKKKTAALKREEDKRAKAVAEALERETEARRAQGEAIAEIAMQTTMNAFDSYLSVVEAVASRQEVNFARIGAEFVKATGIQIMGIGTKWIIEGAGQMAATKGAVGAETVAVGVLGFGIGAAMATTGTVAGAVATNSGGGSRGGGGGGGGSGGSSVARRDRRSRGDSGGSEPSTVTIQYFGGTHLGDTAARVQSHDRDQRRATRNLALPGRR